MSALRALVASAIAALVLAACAGVTPAVSPAETGTGIAGTAVAGPVCPVETTPPAPACAPRPVAGAELVIRDGSGGEVARAKTGPDGTFLVPVAAGSYVLVPQPAEGLMGTAPEQSVVVVAGERSDVIVVYDTGIRGPAPAP